MTNGVSPDYNKNHKKLKVTEKPEIVVHGTTFTSDNKGDT